MVKERIDLYDLDEDGIVSDEELDKVERVNELENKDERDDAQRRMAWFALSGLLFYPLLIVVCNVLELGEAGKILGDTGGGYFVSVAAIVAAFYGKEAYLNKKR